MSATESVSAHATAWRAYDTLASPSSRISRACTSCSRSHCRCTTDDWTLASLSVSSESSSLVASPSSFSAAAQHRHYTGGRVTNCVKHARSRVFDKDRHRICKVLGGVQKAKRQNRYRIRIVDSKSTEKSQKSAV